MNEVISDEHDLASHLEQIASDMKVKEIQAMANKLEAEPVGHCLFCGEKFLTDSRMRWCDRFCSDAWSRQKALKR